MSTSRNKIFSEKATSDGVKLEFGEDFGEFFLVSIS